MDGGAPPPPPPPPPHGQNPKSTSSGLPQGNYDIFIIPPHSSGGGFLYLPSLKPQANSFAAGLACGALLTYLSLVVTPVIKQWWRTVSQSGGGVGIAILVLAVGFAGWAWGTREGFGKTGSSSGPGPTPQNQQQQQQAPPPPPNPNAGPGFSSPPPNNHQQSGYQQPPPNGPAPGCGPQPGHTYGHDHRQDQQRQQQERASDRSYTATPPPYDGPDPFERYGKQKAKTQPSASEADSDERPKPRPRAYSNASSKWDKAREETKRRDEERRKAEEEKRRQDEEKQRKEEADRAARAAAEKEKWEKMRAREKEIKEREAREKIARERLQKEREKLEKERLEREAKAEQERRELEAKLERERLEQQEKERVDKEQKEAADRAAKEAAEKEARLQAAKERVEKAKADQAAARIAATTAAASSASAPIYGVGERIDPYSLDVPKSTTAQSARPAKSAVSGISESRNVTPTPKTYVHPTAKSYVGSATAAESTARSHNPPRRPAPYSSTESMASSDYSWAPSQSTAPTSPSMSHRGPFRTTDPDKVVIKAVYLFSDGFPKPKATLIAGQDGITDGLVLRITSEGMFVDDEVKGTGLRQWDVKAWTMKGVESTTLKSAHLHVVRATIRDAESKKYLFILSEDEAWKVVQGLQKLKQGSQVRSFGLTSLAANEATRLMALLGYV